MVCIHLLAHKKYYSMKIQPHFYLLLLTFTLIGFQSHAQETEYRMPPSQTYRDAMLLFDQQNFGAARGLFSQAMQEESQDKGAYYENAAYYSIVCAVELKDKDAYNKALEFASSYPESAWIPSIKFEMAKLLFNDRKYSESLEILNDLPVQQLSQDQRIVYYYQKGYSEMKLNRYDAAINSFAKVSDTKTEYGRAAKYYYAHLQYLRKNYDEALTGFKAIENDRKFKKYIPNYLMHIYYVQGLFEKVIDEGELYYKNADKSSKAEMARLLGNAWYNLGNYTKALEYYQFYENQGRNERNPGEQYRIGYCKFMNVLFKEAIPNFQEATKEGGTMEQNAWYHLGFCYVNTEQTKFAQNAFLKAYKLKSDPEVTSDALFNYIKTTIELGGDLYNDPVVFVEEFIDENPGSVHLNTAYALLSQLYLSSRNYDAAIRSIESTQNPDKTLRKVYQQITYQQGVNAFNRGSYQDAIDFFEKSQTYPLDEVIMAKSLFWQGDAYYRMKQYNLAERKFNAFLNMPAARQTDLVDVARYNLAYTAFNQKKYQLAISGFERFLNSKNAAKGQISDAWLRLADSYFILKQYNTAMQWYQKVIKSGAKDADYALFQLAACYGSSGNFQQKIDQLIQLTQNYAKSIYYTDALYEIASTYLILNDQRLAINYFNRIVKEKGNSQLAKKSLVKIGFLYYKNGQNNEAIKVLKQVVDRYPASNEAKESLNTLQSIYMDMGKVDQYLDYAKGLDFIQISTSQEDSLTFTTGENYYLSEDCPNTIRALKQYLVLYPNGGFVLPSYHYLTECYEKTGQTAEALDIYAKIAALPENEYTPTATLKLARAAFAAGDYGKSQQYYARLSQMEEHPQLQLEALDGTMQSAFLTGDYSTARQAAKNLLMTERIAQDQIINGHFLLGKMDMMDNNTAQALKEFTLVANLDLGEKGAEASYQVALLNYRSNQLETAENQVYDLAEKFPDQDYWIAKAFILLADIYVGRDNIFQAEQTLQSVIENYKGDDLKTVAQEKLLRLQEYNQLKMNNQDNENEIQDEETK